VKNIFLKNLASGKTMIGRNTLKCVPVAYPGILFEAGGSTNSVKDRGQREWGSGDSSPLVRGSVQFANE
jgi:hypothetical protein